MSKRNVGVVAVIGAWLLLGPLLATAGSADRLLASFGQFQLDDGEAKTVMRGAAIKGYRVCMDDDAGAVPLKVRFDGQEVVVEPGECQLIQATKIKLASASKLNDGMTLIGSFNASSTKKYRTTVSVAQAARNN
jgi:hypothetical protein